jgi:molecular chaperone HtpG
MKPGQQAIYYVTGDTFEAAAHSPHLEIFARRASRCCCCRIASTNGSPRH